MRNAQGSMANAHGEMQKEQETFSGEQSDAA
jgi:hypothetical protein